MPIRVGQQGPPMAIPVPEPEPEVSELEQVLSQSAAGEPEVPAGPKFSADKVDPMVARYMTSDMGPFVCQNCDHFTETGECEVVAGPIDPEGVCILFTRMPQEQAEELPELPTEDVEGLPEDEYESA